MNRLSVLFVGIFTSFLIGWIAMVRVPLGQIGRLQPDVNEETGDIFPPTPSGLAIAGEKVYAANGCVYCHTQIVRPEEEGSDIARKWGDRRTVARDYIRQTITFPGTQRIGPDLTNVGVRYNDAKWQHQHLYNPRSINAWSRMPSFDYLYVTRKIVGQKSDEALDLKGEFAPPAGYEVVPTTEARELVAYLLSLNRNYPLKEAPLPEK
jgi:cytochrome c oxidase cbb3-type subunit II